MTINLDFSSGISLGLIWAEYINILLKISYAAKCRDAVVKDIQFWKYN